VTESSCLIDIVTGYSNKLFISTFSTEILGIVIGNSLSWKAHIDQLIPELCTACYALEASKPFMSQGTGKLVYSLMNYGIIFSEYSCLQTKKTGNENYHQVRT
jgi:hypothetical protein